MLNNREERMIFGPGVIISMLIAVVFFFSLDDCALPVVISIGA